MESLFLHAANGVATIHIVYMIVFVVGTMLVLLNMRVVTPLFKKIYLALVSVHAASNAVLGFCFLTYIERYFRIQADPLLLDQGAGGFVSSYAAKFNIFVTDQNVFLIVTVMMLFGVGSIIYREWRPQAGSSKFKLFSKSMARLSVLTLVIVFGNVFVQQVRAGGGGGGGGPSCAGLVNLSVLSTNGLYMTDIPADPQGESTNGAGYEISLVGDRVTVSAPDAELGEVISVMR